MCGINGIAGMHDSGLAGEIINSMNNTLAHRGPDDYGVFAEPEIALGHRRLSIIDLSSAGHQPMFSSDQRYCITFNGEIYNFTELKNQLDDYPYTNQTDTEVILAAYQRWGKFCVEKLDGMFVFGIWDRVKKELFIARDRLGIKPLYFYQQDEKLYFSSEMRSLLQSDAVPRELNYEGLVDYLRYQTVHAPATIIKNVQMLMPGHFMIYKKSHLQIQEYWNPVKNKQNHSEISTKSYSDIKKRVSELLHNAVDERLMADVPFGAFLSGGIDSSIIVGLMSKLCNQKVNTFSVSFAEKELDESKYARMVAELFNTNHTEIPLKPKDFLDYLPNALDAMDHPSGDGPNTYVVSKVTRDSGIVVALSGLGGDEVFAGYDTFKQLNRLIQNRWMLKLPAFSRGLVGSLLKQIKPGGTTAKINRVLTLENWDLKSTYPITRQVLQEEQLESLLNRDELAPNRVIEIVKENKLDGRSKDGFTVLSKISVAELSTYMQNVLLRDTDQMSMASALEVRVPFLDHQLIEYVLAVPDKYKYPSTPKKLLIDATEGLLPEEVIDRPKMGFTLPWEKWLKDDLKPFCETQLHNLGKRKEFNAAEINQLWQSFLKDSGKIGWARIWILVVLSYWLDKNNIND